MAHGSGATRPLPPTALKPLQGISSFCWKFVLFCFVLRLCWSDMVSVLQLLFVLERAKVPHLGPVLAKEGTTSSTLDRYASHLLGAARY